MRQLTTIIGGLLILAGCGKSYHNFELDEQSFDQETRQSIEKAIGFQLPTNARGLNYYYKAPIDPSFVARFEIPSTARGEMLRSLSAITNLDVHVVGAVSERVKWWTPKKGKILIDRQRINGESYCHAILTDEGDRLILYLDWNL